MAFTNVRRVDLAMGFSAIMGEFTAAATSTTQSYTLGPGKVVGVFITPTESSTTNTDTGSGLYVINYSSGQATLTVGGNGTFLLFFNTGG